MPYFDTTDAGLARIVTKSLELWPLLDAVVFSRYDGSIDVEAADDHVLVVVETNPGTQDDVERRLGAEYRSRGIRVLQAWRDDDEPEPRQYVLTWTHVVDAESYADAITQGLATIRDPANTATFMRADRTPEGFDMDVPHEFSVRDPGSVFLDALVLTDHAWLAGQFHDWLERNPDEDWPFSTNQPLISELAEFYVSTIYDPKEPVPTHPI